MTTWGLKWPKALAEVCNMQSLYDNNFTAILIKYSVWSDLRKLSSSLTAEAAEVKKTQHSWQHKSEQWEITLV